MILSSICTTSWLKASVPGPQLALYFTSSVSGGLIFLLASFSPFQSSFLTILALLLLLGVPPFHYWRTRVLPALDFASLCFFLGPIKLGYMSLLTSNNSITLFFLVPSAVLGLLLFYFASSPWGLLFSSSCSSLFIIVMLGSGAGFFYLTFYVYSLILLSSISLRLITPLLGFLVLAGFPPFTIFWAKISALLSSSFPSGILVLVFACFGLYPYFSYGVLHPVSFCTSSSFFIFTQAISFR